jgi:putative heme-binding domain-containing protein
MRWEDADDPQLPLMIWYGLEPSAAAEPQQAAALCQKPILPLLRRHLARRLTSENDRNSEAINQLFAFAAQNAKPAAQLDILRGMIEALAGRKNVAAPAAWSQAAETFANSTSADVQEATRELGVIFGDQRAITALRAIAADQSAAIAPRRRAIRLLAELGGAETLALLLELTSESSVANDAIRGLAGFDDGRIAVAATSRFPTLDAEGQAIAVDTLCSRPAYARHLIEEIDAGKLPRNAISAAQARQIANLNDAALIAELERVWGAARPTADDKRAQIDRLRIILAGGKIAAGDASQGRALFDKHCSSCHILYGQGKQIGPDLTGSDRGNLNYLLENIVDPSASVGAEFRTSAILLSSGQALSGVVVGKTDHALTVQTPTDKVTIDLDDVEEMVEQPLSLMPDGLLTPLTDAEIGDLFAYLQSKSQVELPTQ